MDLSALYKGMRNIAVSKKHKQKTTLFEGNQAKAYIKFLSMSFT